MLQTVKHEKFEVLLIDKNIYMIVGKKLIKDPQETVQEITKF